MKFNDLILPSDVHFRTSAEAKRVVQNDKYCKSRVRIVTKGGTRLTVTLNETILDAFADEYRLINVRDDSQLQALTNRILETSKACAEVFGDKNESTEKTNTWKMLEGQGQTT